MSLLHHAPALTAHDAARLARELYGLDAIATALPSERDQNFRLDVAATGRSEPAPAFVLKIANATEPREPLEAQNAALAHVALRLDCCPRVVPTLDGSDLWLHEGHFVRLLTWLPGVPMGAVRHHSATLLADLGRRVGQLGLALQSFDHPAAHRAFHWDLARGLATSRDYAGLIEDPGLRAVTESLLSKVADAAPLFAALARSTIHNDANDYNVLVSGGPLDGPQQVTGIIDFGDLVHSYTIADLAVAVAYAVLGKRDPMAAAAHVVRGYHAARRLADGELSALFPLVRLRLCLSVCLAAHQQRQRPGDAYLGISQGPIAAVLPVLARTSADEAETALRSARDTADLLARRRSSLGRNLGLVYDAPLRLVRGSMQYVFDERGRRYLDAYNNVPHVGHGHPRVVQAAAAQMALLNTNTRYLHELAAEYAERLTATLPGALRVCYFVNSGSEANELALRLARAHTGQRDLIVLDAAYHGNTTTLIAISPYKFTGPGGAGQPSWVHVVPMPDVYRGAFKAGEIDAGARYAMLAADAIARLEERGSGLCGFIAETCPSVGGQIVPPAGYLREVYRHVRGAGGVCIADEVQTGLGRMGTSCYAFEHQEVVPDIVVLGKPIGNGYPLGAVVTTEAIAASFDNGMEFFSTFGGSTVSCAAGLAVLDVLRDEALQEHARRVGDRLLARLRSLVPRHPAVGDVRGSGLFIGVELIRDRGTLEPAPREAAFVANRMREEGILIGTDGPFHNVLKIRPPLPFNGQDADHLVSALDAVLGELDP